MTEIESIELNLSQFLDVEILAWMHEVLDFAKLIKVDVKFDWKAI